MKTASSLAALILLLGLIDRTGAASPVVSCKTTQDCSKPGLANYCDPVFSVCMPCGGVCRPGEEMKCRKECPDLYMSNVLEQPVEPGMPSGDAEAGGSGNVIAIVVGVMGVLLAVLVILAIVIGVKTWRSKKGRNITLQHAVVKESIHTPATTLTIHQADPLPSLFEKCVPNRGSYLCLTETSV